MEPNYIEQIRGQIYFFKMKIWHYYLDVCESIQPPYQVFVDFTTAVTSKTQPQAKLMHPSCPTAVNTKRWIHNEKDLNDLLTEMSGKNLYSDIILSHNNVRTPGGDNILSSDLKILGILNLFMYIMLDDFE